MKSGIIANDLSVEAIQTRVDDRVQFVTDLPEEEDQLVDAVRGHDIIITSSEVKFSRDVLERIDVELIAKTGSGLDNIDVDAATANGVTVVHTPGANASSVAEHALALTLAVKRNIIVGHRTIEHNQWRNTVPLSTPLSDQTVGILGFGAVGQQIATRLSGFSTTILAYDPYINDNVEDDYPDVTLTDLESLLEAGDVIVVATKLTSETRGMIGAEAFDRMKDSAVLVNVARGPVVDESALVQALETDTIAGAGLDVFETEPLPQSAPVRNCKNVVLTPHIAGRSVDAARETYDLIADAVNRFVRDEPIPDHLVASDPG